MFKGKISGIGAGGLGEKGSWVERGGKGWRRTRGAKS